MPLLSGSKTSTTSPISHLRESDLRHTNEFGLGRSPHGNQVFAVDQTRARSPKDKILVTCLSRGKN